jgi:NADH-quinone oxidoreductase subunit C
MTPEEIGSRAAELLGGSAEVSYGEVTVDVAPERWVGAAAAVRDDPDLAFDFFDWLSAVDELEQGFAVLMHLYSTVHRHRILLRTRIPLTAPQLSTVTGVFAGAAWHERETHEMFGIGFAGHPGLKPLLLPDGFEGNPLRKEFVLASRVAKEWPGAREPGEGHGGTRRRRMQPLGVPEPGTWGPRDE